VQRAIVASVAAILVCAWLLVPPGLMPAFGSRSPSPDPEATRARLSALARSKVFADPAANGIQPPIDRIDCRFLNTPVSGTSAKFDCTLEDGSRLRVKYGWTDEIQGEAAATRLLATLGFGADHVSIARHVRCYGCPWWPMLERQAAGRLYLGGLLNRTLRYDHYTDFEWTSVERRNRHADLKFGDQEGWGWNELSAIDPALGGATHAEIDALRLIAIFLNHWDNKPSNQRLVCPASPAADEPPRCDHPLALIQDAGSTFGPRKVNLRAWSASPVWADAASCTLSMTDLPYHGGTFKDVRVSEEGRRLLLARLARLTAPQVTALFTEAHFDQVDGWVAAFARRVDALARRPPCPAAS
jgi:hypothetical protein